MKIQRLIPIAVLALLAGCQTRTTSKGWASEVPADATRFVRQTAVAEAPEKPKPIVEKPTVEKPSAPVYGANITEPTKIVLWHSYRADEKAAMKQVIDAFNALGTKITVKARSVPFDAFNDKVQIVVPRGRGPDLFIFAHDTIGTWAQMDIIEPLNDWVTEEQLEPFLDYTLGPLVWREALYGLPLAFKSPALIYNKALVKTPPKTFEELVAEAKKHTSGTRYGLVYEATNLYFHAPWLFGLGGQVLDDSDEPVIDSPAALNALNLARALVHEHKVTPRSVSATLISGYFNSGDAAMVINGPWMRGEIEGIDYGVAPLPTIDGQPARPFLTVEALYLNKQGTQKEAAMEVARYLVSDAAAKVRFEVGKQPVANKALWEGGGADEHMLGFFEQAKVAVPTPSSPRMQQMWAPYNGALLNTIASDTGNAAAALKEAQADALRAVQRAKSKP